MKGVLKAYWIFLRSLRSYALLIKEKSKISLYSLNTVIALVLTSVLLNRDLFNFARNLVLSVLAMLATVFCVYFYNDLTDLEIDRLNKLNRPLATGKVSQDDTRNLIILLGITGLTLGYIINLEVLLLLFTFLILGLMYSFPVIRLKRRFLIKDLVIAIGSAITPMVGGATVEGTIPTPVFLLAGYCFLASLTMTPLKDLRDFKGDKIYQVKTIPIVWGPQLTIRFSVAIMISMAIATVIGYVHLGFNIAFGVLASSVFIGWIYVTYPLFHKWEDSSYIIDTIVKKQAPVIFLLEILTVLGAIV